MLYEKFECQVQSGWSDFTLAVIPIRGDNNIDMVICHKDGPIYITKEQAMKFFDLKPND